LEVDPVPISPDDRPRRSAAVAGEATPEGSITVTSGARVVELNATAAALWALCDGRTAVSEIVLAAHTLFASPADTIEHDILATLQTLEQQGLVTR
jgi:hypothetical protein